MPHAGAERLITKQQSEVLLWIELAEQQVDEYFGSLEPVERQRYLALARRPALPDPLGPELKRIETMLCAHLKISSLGGYWVHTRLPGEAAKSSGITHFFVGMGVPTKPSGVATVSLADFIRHGVDATLPLRGGTAELFFSQSWINGDPTGARGSLLDLRAVVDAVREFDPGGLLDGWVERQLGGRRREEGLWPVFRQEVRDQFELALLEAQRSEAITLRDVALITRQVLSSSAGEGAHPIWRQVVVHLGGDEFDIPGCLFDIVDEHGLLRQFVYLPGCQDGELQLSAGGDELAQTITDALRNDLRAGRANWMLDLLSEQDRQAVMSAVKRQPVNEAGLNPLAKVLYDWLGRDNALKQVSVTIRSPPDEPVPLLEFLASARAKRLRDDARHAFKSNGMATWERSQQILGALGKEVLSILTLSVPGNVVFPGRNYIFMGAMAWNLRQLTYDATLSKWQDVVQSVTDLVDFVVASKGTAYLGRLGFRRSLPVGLHVGRGANGRLVVWAENDLARYSESILPAGSTPLGEGLWRTGRDVRAMVLASDGQVRYAKVMDEQGQYRLVHASLGGIAPLLRRGGDGFWRLHVDDAAGLSEARLLRRMLHPELRDLTDADLEHVVSASGTSRATLEAVWRGERMAPAGLAEAVISAADRLLARSLGTRLASSHYGALEPRAEYVVMARLADMAECELHVVDRHSDDSPIQFLPFGWDRRGDFLPVVRVVREGPWRYRAYADMLGPSVEPEDSLFQSVIRAREKVAVHRAITWPTHMSRTQSAAWLRHQTAQWFTDPANRGNVLAALHHRARRRKEVPLGEGDLRPVDYGPFIGGYPEARVEARRRHPELREEVLVELVKRWPEHPSGALSPEVIAWLDAVSAERREALAWMAIQSVDGLGMTLRAEALFIETVRQLPGYPADLSVAVRDAQGRLLRAWGNAQAEPGITIVRHSERGGSYTYQAQMPGNDRVDPMRRQHSLASVMLQGMDDGARGALGLPINDASALQRRIAAHVPRIRLDATTPVELFDPVPTAEQLRTFRMRNAIAASVAEADGIHRWKGGNFVIMGGHSYRVLRDAEASEAGDAIWRIVHDEGRAADVEYPRDASPSNVAIHRVYGDWRLAGAAHLWSPELSPHVMHMRVRAHRVLVKLNRASIRQPEARFYSIGARTYVRAGSEDGGDFFSVRLPEQDGVIEILNQSRSGEVRSHSYLQYVDGRWREYLGPVPDEFIGESRVGQLSTEALGNLRMMERERHFVGVINVHTRRIDIAPSYVMGKPGVLVERRLPDGMVYHVGPSANPVPMPISEFHVIGRIDGELRDTPGHQVLAKMMGQPLENFGGFSGYLSAQRVVRLKFTSWSLNPRHQPCSLGQCLGEAGDRPGSNVLPGFLRIPIIMQFRAAGYEVLG